MKRSRIIFDKKINKKKKAKEQKDAKHHRLKTALFLSN